MPVGDIYQMTLAASSLTQLGENVFFLRATAVTAPEPDDEFMALFIENLVFDSYKKLLTTQCRYEGMRFQKVAPAPKRVAVYAKLHSGAGLGGAAALPKQISGLMSKLTPFAGARYRGRTYFPFPAESDNDDTSARPSTAYQVKMANFAGDMLAGFNPVDVGSVTLQWVLYNPRTGTFAAITSTRQSGFWAQQHRRSDYGRPNIIG